jgi:hypothetical protein
MRRKQRAPRTWPAAAIVLYSLGLLTVLGVSLSLGGEETAPAAWSLVAIPVALFAAGSSVVRRAERSSGADEFPVASRS